MQFLLLFSSGNWERKREIHSKCFLCKKKEMVAFKMVDINDEKLSIRVMLIHQVCIRWMSFILPHSVANKLFFLSNHRCIPSKMQHHWTTYDDKQKQRYSHWAITVCRRLMATLCTHTTPLLHNKYLYNFFVRFGVCVVAHQKRVKMLIMFYIVWHGMKNGDKMLRYLYAFMLASALKCEWLQIYSCFCRIAFSIFFNDRFHMYERRRIDGRDKSKKRERTCNGI